MSKIKSKIELFRCDGWKWMPTNPNAAFFVYFVSFYHYFWANIKNRLGTHEIFKKSQLGEVNIWKKSKILQKTFFRIQLRKKINQRLVASDLRDVSFNNRILSSAESEGRMVVPRLLIAFQRNNIRPDVNPGKKVNKMTFFASICRKYMLKH